MRRRFLFVGLPLLVIAGIAPAQQMIQSGKPLPGHTGKWITNLTLGDAGPANGGPAGTGLTELNITSQLNNNLPFCINDAPITGPYHQLCMGAGGVISYGAFGGAPPQGLVFTINGSTYPFPGTGQGNVLGPNVTAIPEIASFNNVTGTLLRQGRGQVTDSLTGPVAPASEGAAVLGRSQNGYTAQQIANWIFCNCTTAVSYDAIRGIGISTLGTSIDLVNGVAGYVMAQAPIAGPYPTAVALFGMGIADVNGASVWGINTALSDNRGLVASSGTGRQLINEFDLNFTSTSSTGIGLSVGGGSIAQPASSSAVVCADLDNHQGTIAKWGTCFYSNNGVAGYFANIGRANYAIASSSSQIVQFNYGNAGGVNQTIVMSANGGSLNLSGSAGASLSIVNGDLFFTVGGTGVFDQTGGMITSSSGTISVGNTNEALNIGAGSHPLNIGGGTGVIDLGVTGQTLTIAGTVNLSTITNAAGPATQYVCTNGSGLLIVQAAAC
jgi:hypothetical protein